MNSFLKIQKNEFDSHAVYHSTKPATKVELTSLFVLKFLFIDPLITVRQSADAILSRVFFHQQHLMSRHQHS